jgi:hypothetical protein
MRTAHRKQVTIGLVMALWLTLGHAAGGQATAGRLDRRVRDVRVEAENAAAALSQIAYDYNVPIGVEAASKGKWRAVRIDLREATLREVLDAVAAQDPRYEWREEGGVVNFTPTADRDELSADVLGTTVSHLSIEQGTSRASIKDKILELPAVKAKLEKAGVSAGFTGLLGRDYDKIGPGFTLQVSNVTVREVLNQIISTSEAKCWIVNRYGDKHENFVLNF